MKKPYTLETIIANRPRVIKLARQQHPQADISEEAVIVKAGNALYVQGWMQVDLSGIELDERLQ